MDREAEQGRRPLHGIFPPNYVTLQQLKENKEKEFKRQKEEEEKKKKRQQEQERRKIKEPSVLPRSGLPPNYVTLQQLKERKEQKLQREEEDGRNNQEEKEKNKLQEQSLRPRRDVGCVNRDPSDSGWHESTREDSEKKNLRQAAKNGCRGATANGAAKDDRGPSGRLHGDRKTFTGWVLGNPAHRQKNGEAPSDVHQEDATVEPCVWKVGHGKGNIGEAAMKSSSDSEIPRAKGNGDTDLRNNATLVTGRISRLASKGELMNTKAVGFVEEGTEKVVTMVPEETKEDENKNERRKGRRRYKKRTNKKLQNQAQASEDSANTATVEEEAAAVVPVTENVPAAEDTVGDGEIRKASEKQKEKKGECSVRYLEKDSARKIVLATSSNERQRRSRGRYSEKRASLMWVKKG